MKRIVPLAACAAFSLHAQAQSSVTLYGIIDEGINYNSNMEGGRSYGLESAVMQGSRWGFRGDEDLGNGLHAIFTLENGFDNNTGKSDQNGALFGRQAFVGLSKKSWGALTFGRQYDVNADFVGPLEAASQWAGNIGAHLGDMDNLNDAWRINNSVKYTSAVYHGLSFGALYGLGGVPGSVGRNQAWSVALRYAQGPLVLAAGYNNVRNPNVSVFGNEIPAAQAAETENSTYPSFSGFMSARTWQVASVGGNYTFGASTVGLVYSNIAFQSLGDTSSGPDPSGYEGSVHFSTIEGSYRYQFTPSLLVGIAYVYTNRSRISSSTGVNPGATYQQAMAAIDYSLSTRTDVYLLGVFQQASGTDSLDLPAVASITNQAEPSSSDRQTVIRIGIRHRF
ncbi:porin [Burkholderia sp. WAC0059]|uniref:porin n=1 Tax=Burkholderia sp. WAC0059 TaxID=2066022 RepID=UPI000C7EE9A4|nr:porin [Burkholderia sp. WAC0059]PLZ02848.1 porin [Burkholderia sp. WAC0059]